MGNTFLFGQQKEMLNPSNKLIMYHFTKLWIEKYFLVTECTWASFIKKILGIGLMYHISRPWVKPSHITAVVLFFSVQSMWKYFILLLSVSRVHVMYFKSQPFSGAYGLGRRGSRWKVKQGPFPPPQTSWDLPFPDWLWFPDLVLRLCPLRKCSTDDFHLNYSLTSFLGLMWGQVLISTRANIPVPWECRDSEAIQSCLPGFFPQEVLHISTILWLFFYFLG